LPILPFPAQRDHDRCQLTLEGKEAGALFPSSGKRRGTHDKIGGKSLTNSRKGEKVLAVLSEGIDPEKTKDPKIYPRDQAQKKEDISFWGGRTFFL